MKIQELRQLTPKKLLAELQKLTRELAVIRFHVKTGQDQNHAQIKKLSRTIAQIKTLLGMNKEIQEPSNTLQDK